MLRICLSGFIVPQETRPVTEERRVRGGGARKQHARQPPPEARRGVREAPDKQRANMRPTGDSKQQTKASQTGGARQVGRRSVARRGALDRTLGKRRDIGQERSGTKPRRQRRQPEKWQGPFEPDTPSGHLIWALAWSSATKHATVLVCLAISRARGAGQGVGTKRRQMGGMAKQTEGNALQKNPSLQETMLRYWRHAERSAP